MKTLKNKPLLRSTASSNNGGKVSNINKNIKLKEVTAADRQRLRIPSYQYLLP